MAFRNVIDVETVSRIFLDASNAFFGFYMLIAFACIVFSFFYDLVLTFPISTLFMMYVLVSILILLALIYIMFRISEITLIAELRRGFIFITLAIIILSFNVPYGLFDGLTYGFIYPVIYLFYLLIIRLNSLILMIDFSIPNIISIMGAVTSIAGFSLFAKSLYKLSKLCKNSYLFIGGLSLLLFGFISPIIIGLGLRFTGLKLEEYLKNKYLIGDIKGDIISNVSEKRRVEFDGLAKRYNVAPLLPLIIWHELRLSGII